MRNFYKIIPFLLIFFAFSLKQDSPFFQNLVIQAVNQTKIRVTYVPAYVQIKYPNGDVPSNTGVCTDLVIRALRGVGIYIQKFVHSDMG